MSRQYSSRNVKPSASVSLVADSPAGAGARFTIRLPASPPGKV